MSLDVHLYGERVGELFEAGADAYRFAYSPECVEKYGAGTAVLSTSLPASEEPFSPGATRAYVEGLLPEGMRRHKLARELGVDPGDGYGLIAALGHDCPGAATFRPAGEPAPAPHCENPSPAWADEEELEELVAGPPRRFFDPDRPRRMRVSLPGVRHKLGLARPQPDGPWAWPGADMPSTHIVKPETGEHPEMVPNEMFCTAVAAEIGLPVPPTGVETIAGRRCLVAGRFDRGGEHAGVRRLHQETFCQALSFEPDADEESEDADGPWFAESAGLLRAVGEEDKVPTLLTAALSNYILGNGDAHGKNFALMILHDGAVLAPFYDIVSTAVYDDPTHTGMVIADDYAEIACLLELALICDEADVELDDCRRLAAAVAARIGAALEAVAARAHSEGWHAPVVDGIVDLASERALGLGYEVEY